MEIVLDIYILLKWALLLHFIFYVYASGGE